MNPCVILFLGGDVGDDPVVIGAYQNHDAAFTFIVSTGAPWNYQICDVWGPAVKPPMGILGPIVPTAGAWIAISSIISLNGLPTPIGYGEFATKAAGRAWAASLGLAGPGFTLGQVISPS